MKEMLGEEQYILFAEAMKRPPRQALRINTLKEGWERFEAAPVFALQPVPWAPHGFYYGEGERPGKSPLHEAGLYYMQEPSAMAVAALSGLRPGEAVLDLCAAPGGKSTHLAAMTGGRGFLVSNEIHPARARILSQNIERMGIRNAVVLGETPQRLAERMYGLFDRVVVDAPCSGEGMFRKEEQAIPNWSPENVEMCAARQDEILDCAAQMTRPGGAIVYSTRTFAPQEDEGSLQRFLQRHPDFAAEDLPARIGAERMREWGLDAGHPEWTAGEEAARSQEKGALRLWPHRLDGEGHFMAVLRREGAAAPERKERGGRPVTDALADREKREAWLAFAADALQEIPEGYPVLFGEALWLMPVPMDLGGLKVLRAGLCLGEFRRNRFEPAHALALAIGGGQAKRVYDIASGSPEAAAYLRGESIPVPPGTPAGWTLVTTDGFSLGWGKTTGGMLKNHYPKGLRR